MATQAQPINGATIQEDPRAEERRNLAALDGVISETERAAKERLILRRAELDYKQRLASAFAKSGCFADIKGQSEAEAIAKALVKIELGEAMGFTPAESMTGIDIIQGRVAVGANLRAARMQRAGYSWPEMVLNETGCWIPLRLNGKTMLDGEGNPVMVAFTKSDAQTAGLAGKDNYKKNPRNMYFARAITNAQRWYAPGVLGIDVLSIEEARDLPREDLRDSIRTSVSLEQVKASADENRGHDGASASTDPPPMPEGVKPVTKEDTDRAAEELHARQAAEAAEQPATTVQNPPSNEAPKPEAPAEQPAQAQQRASAFSRPKFGFKPAPAKG